VLRRLGRTAEQAAAYKDISGPEWGPRLAALVCCARYLEHHLREGPEPLLLLDLQVAFALSLYLMHTCKGTVFSAGCRLQHRGPLHRAHYMASIEAPGAGWPT
jgi:hypothetical protein